MCLPLWSNRTQTANLHFSNNEIAASLINSPFPCEQEFYLEAVCAANGTAEIDFLAEQECLCNSAFFDILHGCDACYAIHGYLGNSMGLANDSSEIASLSAAECQPSPPFQPFSNLLSTVNITSASEQPAITLGVDHFPNNTAISNYWTPTRSITPGEITGSATARATSWTNYDGVRYTPTSIPPNSGITSSPSISSSIGSGATASSSAVSSSTVSGNVAAGKDIQAAGGLLAAILGMAVLL